MKDVAEFAGVSMKTVSNVVRGYRHVSPKMRTRVQRAIVELEYVPNTTARRLATGRTGMIALAVPALDVPYFAELATAVSEAASERDFRVLIEQTAGGIEAERQIVVGRERGLVDGVIFQPTRLGSAEIAALRGELPLVLLGEVVPPLSVDHVMINNLDAAKAATSHLIAAGRRRIGFLGHERWYRPDTFNQRLVGYQSALEHHGLPVLTELLLPAKDFGATAGDAAVMAAAEAGIVFDGLMCYDDLTAIGALRALHRLGRNVPDEVGVVGWDDIALAEFMNPALTTIVADRVEVARRAIDMLIGRIAGFDGPGRHELISFELAIRSSSCARDLQR